jgi:hypothetical protein
MKKLYIFTLLILAVNANAQVTVEDAVGCKQDTMNGVLKFYDANLPNNKIESIQILYTQGGCVLSYSQDTVLDDTCKLQFSAKKWGDHLKIYFKLNGTYRCHIYKTVTLDCGVLPVELIYYEADSLILRWATATEMNSWYYQIVESGQVIGTVEAAGNSTVINKYQFEVEHAGYYYLSQIDFDGTVNELGVVCVDYQPEKAEPIYYTLQGQRIEQPVTPCIRCVGSECKIVVN